MRELIIEDDRRLARLIADVLAEEGCVVDVAGDGETGLDLALGGAYDVAIVDWMLPGRDGRRSAARSAPRACRPRCCC